MIHGFWHSFELRCQSVALTVVGNHPFLCHFTLYNMNALRLLIVNNMFQIHRLHCYSSSPKLNYHYHNVKPLLYHVCNIFLWIIKSAYIVNWWRLWFKVYVVKQRLLIWLSMLLGITTKPTTIVVLQKT